MTTNGTVFLIFILWCAVTGGMIGHIGAKRRWSMLKLLVITGLIVIFNSVLRLVIPAVFKNTAPVIVEKDAEKQDK